MSRRLHGGNAAALPAFLAAAALVALVAETVDFNRLLFPLAGFAFFSLIVFLYDRFLGASPQNRLRAAWGVENADTVLFAFAALLPAAGMLMMDLVPGGGGVWIGAALTLGGLTLAAILRDGTDGRETLTRVIMLSIVLLALFSFFERQLFLRLIQPVALGVTALSGLFVVLGELRRLKPAVMVFMALWMAALSLAAWKSWSVPLELPVRTQADEKLLREAFGDVVMMTLLPGRDRVRVFFKSDGNPDEAAAAAAIIGELPYVKAAAMDIPGAAKSSSVGDFDVVIVRSGMPEQLTGCELMFPAYARMAKNGCLVVRRGLFDVLPPKSRAALAEFSYRYPLEYPNNYEVFSNFPPQVSLEKLDGRLAKLAPGNPLVPADVLGYLMKQANKLRPPMPTLWTAPSGPDLTGMWSWSWWWLLTPGVLLWWLFRLFRGGHGLFSFVLLDGVEDGVYAGTVFAVLCGFSYCSGMIDPVLLGGGAVLIPILMFTSGGAAEKWRSLAALLLLAVSAWWLPNGWVMLAAALVVWRVMRRWIVLAAAGYLPLLAVWPQAAFAGALLSLGSGILVRQADGGVVGSDNASCYNFAALTAAAVTAAVIYPNLTAIMPFAVALVLWRLPAVWRKK